MAVFMFAFVAFMALLFSNPAASFKFGVVSSQSGALTDWNDAVKGVQAYTVPTLLRAPTYLSSVVGTMYPPPSLLGLSPLTAGYQYWIYRMQQVYPTGLPIKDSKGNTYTVPFSLTVQDDTSSASSHDSLITNMVAPGGADFVLNAQPSFADKEAAIVSAAGKINMHGVTSNPSIFTAQLPGVFSVAPSSAEYTTSLFQDYKVNSMKMVSAALDPPCHHRALWLFMAWIFPPLTASQ